MIWFRQCFFLDETTALWCYRAFAKGYEYVVCVCCMCVLSFYRVCTTYTCYQKKELKKMCGEERERIEISVYRITKSIVKNLHFYFILRTLCPTNVNTSIFHYFQSRYSPSHFCYYCSLEKSFAGPQTTARSDAFECVGQLGQLHTMERNWCRTGFRRLTLDSCHL